VRLFTHGYGHSLREVAGSRLGRGTRSFFHPARQRARFSPPNMTYFLNLFRISLPGEAINYRPYVSPSFDFEVASHVKTVILAAIIIIIIVILLLTIVFALTGFFFK